MPRLSEALTSKPNGQLIYLHDLAISKHAKGQGVGKYMVYELLVRAKRLGYTKVLLVAVNETTGFWKKSGFVQQASDESISCYGEGAAVMSLEVSSRAI